VLTPIQILLADLEDILHGVQLVRECSRRTQDLILSLGVRASCLLAVEYLRRHKVEARLAETPGLSWVSKGPGGGRLDYEKSFAALRGLAASAGGLLVVPGGTAVDERGVTVMLRQDGCDLTAALLAAALQVESLELYTERGGVWSADPAFVPEAFVVPELSDPEAKELSYFGARMVHPQALVPAMEPGIPVRVRALARPEEPGTLICRSPSRARGLIAGIASIEPVALVNVEGGGMVGVPGIAARLFGALARSAVNIIMISQASSEHSICVVCRQEEAARALSALKAELAVELEARQIQNLEPAGPGYRGRDRRADARHPGISGRLFGALGRRVNILAIAQGSSETNILRHREKAEAAALRTVHRASWDGVTGGAGVSLASVSLRPGHGGQRGLRLRRAGLRPGRPGTRFT
jgi:aspartokinase/homoserine dehydrogenase 1